MKRNPEFGTANIVGTSPASDQTDGSAVATRGRKLRRLVAGSALLALAGCTVGGNAAPSSSSENTSTATTATSSEMPTPEPGEPDYSTRLSGPDLTTGAPATIQKFTETRQYDIPGMPDTFRNYTNFGGVGPEIPKGKTVEVDCVAYDASQIGNSTAGLYYHITGSRDVQGVADYYTPSNTYWNQPNVGGHDLRYAYDPQVPACVEGVTGGSVPPTPQSLPDYHPKS